MGNQSWSQPLPYSDTVLRLWDRPLLSLYRNTDEDIVDFDEMTVNQATLFRLPTSDEFDGYFVISGLSDNDCEAFRNSIFYKAAERLDGNSFTDENWWFTQKDAQCRFWVLSFLAHGEDYWDMSNIIPDNPMQSYAEIPVLENLVRRDVLTPQMISVAMRHNPMMFSVITGDDDDIESGRNKGFDDVTVGEVAFALARFPNALDRMYSYTHRASVSSERLIEQMTELRASTGTAAFAWFLLMRMTIFKDEQDAKSGVYMKSIKNTTDAGFDFDVAAPFFMAGVQDADAIAELIANDINFDLVVSLSA